MLASCKCAWLVGQDKSSLSDVGSHIEYLILKLARTFVLGPTALSRTITASPSLKLELLQSLGSGRLRHDFAVPAPYEALGLKYCISFGSSIALRKLQPVERTDNGVCLT
jgi:hypothetical protein